MGIDVEILIRGSLSELWQKTQTPAAHERSSVHYSIT